MVNDFTFSLLKNEVNRAKTRIQAEEEAKKNKVILDMIVDILDKRKKQPNRNDARLYFDIAAEQNPLFITNGNDADVRQIFVDMGITPNEYIEEVITRRPQQRLVTLGNGTTRVISLNTKLKPLLLF
jgi:hypothetical protein